MEEYNSTDRTLTEANESIHYLLLEALANVGLCSVWVLKGNNTKKQHDKKQHAKKHRKKTNISKKSNSIILCQFRY